MNEIEWAAREVIKVWDGLSGGQRRIVNESIGHALYKALHGLAVAVEGDDTERSIGVSEAPEPEKMLNDRREALRHARKACQGGTADAEDIVLAAQVFERYLTGGTAEPPAAVAVLTGRPQINNKEKP